MLTIRAEIKKGELKSDGTYNVKLRFTHQRKVKRLSTSLFVRPEDLTKSLSFKNGTKVKNAIDNLVNEYRMRCNRLPIDIEGYTLDDDKSVSVIIISIIVIITIIIMVIIAKSQKFNISRRYCSQNFGLCLKKVLLKFGLFQCQLQ
jgi:hypothetical protein